jgi:telomere length regulation protein
VNREAILLRNVVGELTIEQREMWASISAAAIHQEWDVGRARILVCWAAMSNSSLESLLSEVLDVWTSVDHIKHSLLNRHHCEWV